jgi:epoxyqueuosine reductase
MEKIEQQVREVMEQCGMAHWGACEFEPFRTRLLPCRGKALLPKNAKSILCALFPYYVHLGEHNVSRYAAPPDYHGIVGGMLQNAAKALAECFPNFHFVPFADNSPIPEVSAAARAGLGAVGDNGLLIHPVYGTYVFLGEIVTDLPLPAFDGPAAECLHCGNCRRHCPGGALQPDKTLIRECCLSHLTQKKGALSLEEERLVRKGRSIWGCDLCQDCCPMNRGVPETPLAAFRDGLIPIVHPGDAAQLTGRAYHWRPPEVLERNLRIIPAPDGNASEETDAGPR